MNELRFHQLALLHLLWGVPLLLALLLYAARQRRAALAKFVEPARRMELAAAVRPGRRRAKACLALLGWTLLVLALARPAWHEKELTVKRMGRDVVFALDVSKSMLAEDLKPNRLEHAKLAILDTVDKLQGDRVALVAFAGNAAIKCPLTLDYGFFRQMVADIGPDSVNRGGTMIGDALRTIHAEVFDAQAKQYKDIIVITDGEDQGSFPVEAAKKIGAQGVRLIIVGLGDEKDGQRIPVVDGAGKKSFLKYKGQEVWSKLDSDNLRQVAIATPGGRYLPVATGSVNLGEVYLDLVAGAEKRELEEQTIKRYDEKFQIFLALGLLCLVVEASLTARRVVPAVEIQR